MMARKCLRMREKRAGCRSTCRRSLYQAMANTFLVDAATHRPSKTGAAFPVVDSAVVEGWLRPIPASMAPFRWLLALTLSALTVTVMGAGPPAKLTEEAGEGMQLTPWWALKFSHGETARVDCGVWTGGRSSTREIKWMEPLGTVITGSGSDR